MLEILNSKKESSDAESGLKQMLGEQVGQGKLGLQ